MDSASVIVVLLSFSQQPLKAKCISNSRGVHCRCMLRNSIFLSFQSHVCFRIKFTKIILEFADSVF